MIFGGPSWYRFFGAGERMAQLDARGSAYPTIVTSGIAAVLFIWMSYGLSGAGIIRRLPLLNLALAVIGAIYLTRGVLGIPLVLYADHPYTEQLRAKMTFMVVSSAICVFGGLCYVIGAARMRTSTRR